MAPAHKENEFIPAMIEIIKKHPNGCTMNQIMSEIPDYINLTDGDMELSPSRKGECKYQQIVRNIVSHNNKEFFKHIYSFKSESKPIKNIFKIKEDNEIVPKPTGEETITTVNESKVADTKDNTTNTVPTVELHNISGDCDRYDARLMELIQNPKFDGKIKADQTNINYVKSIYDYQCLYTMLTNGEKKTFEGESGDDFIHGHHLIPIARWRDFFPKSIDRPSNIAPLAPYYHDMIHHGKKESRDQVLKVLYNAMIPGLNKDGIYITLEQLLNYYNKGD